MKATTITDLLWLKSTLTNSQGRVCIASVSKKENYPALYQYPRKRVTATDKIWYERRPLGINKLGSLMKEISSGAELSRIYTNHSVRATCITSLSKANVPSRHIMAINGHKSESSLQHYNQRPSQSQFYEYLSSIASAGKENEYGRPYLTPSARNYSTATLAQPPSGFVTGCQIGTLNIVVNNSSN